MSKVLVINTQGLRNEGITSTIKETFSYMDKQDLTIHLAIVGRSEKSIIEEFEEFGCVIKKLPDRKLNTVKYSMKLFQLIRKEKYDIVHVHGSSSLITLEIVVAVIGCVKARISHIHNTRCSHEYVNKLLRPLLNLLVTDRFACGMDAGKWLYGRKEFTVIHNAKNLEKYRFNPNIRQEVREKLQIQNNYVLGHVGNFNYQKNHEFIIKVFSELIGIDSRWKLILVGEGENKQKIKKIVEKENLTEKVIFTGSVNTVHELLQGFDIAILPSRFEGLPVAAIEYQTAGLYSFLSDYITKECALTQLIQFLPLNQSAYFWAMCITEFIEKKQFREYLSQTACQEIKKAGYDIRKVSGYLRSFYLTH